MIPRIYEVKTLSDYVLLVTFTDGSVVLYDVKDDFSLPEYDSLKNISGLFESVQLDKSRTCVYWNDSIDLPSDIIYKYGKRIHLKKF